MTYFCLSLSILKNEYVKIKMKIRRLTKKKQKKNHNFLFHFFFLFSFPNREPSKIFYSLEVLCSNTARTASGGKWILLHNDWEQIISDLL